MINPAQARSLAEAYARANTTRWDLYKYEVRELVDLVVPGSLLFACVPTYNPDEPGEVLRVGGNMPILVDVENGSCRRLAASEYMRLKSAYRRNV